MTGEKDDFFKWLKHVKTVVAKPMLTEDEFQMLEDADQAAWVRTRAADGAIMYGKKADGALPAPPPQQAEEDDDDDEVIDVTPAGTRLPAAEQGVQSAPRPSPPAAQGAAADVEDYYALLGVSPQASLQEIRSKFRTLVVQHHPEKGGDVKIFQQLNKAYSVLSDQRKRQELDQQLASRGPGGYPAKAFVD